MRASTSKGLRGAALVLVALFAGGCGDDDVAPADSGAPAGDAGAEMCTIPDTTCPVDQPLAGAACDTAETCMYPDPNGMFTWTYRCQDLAWAGTSDCDPMMILGGGCPVGPLAESCRPPFSGMLSGATVEIGDAGTGPFRALTSGERVMLITGGQGSPMVGFRVRVSGVGVPRCVSATTTLTIDAMPPTSEMRSLALHCGTTLPAFQIVADPCDMATHMLDIRVDVAGVGSGHVTVEYVGPACVG